MKAFIRAEDAAAILALADVPEPEPASNEAVIEVGAYSVNRGETFVLESQSKGWRPGKDIAGVVVQAAADGFGPAVGTRVVAHPPAAGWAERVAVATRQIASLPDEIELTTAAVLPLAGLTALRLIRSMGFLASRRVLITGASGGVGHYFTELAAAQGADLTVVSATPQRGEQLRRLGAGHVVNDVAAAEGPFDFVLESVGATSLQEGLVKLKKGATLIWFGQASRTPPTINFFRFWEGPRSGHIRHFDYTDSEISDGEDLATLVNLVRTGRLHPEIGLSQDWSETASALRAVRDRQVRGNAVLTRPSTR
jgi:NADPH:quinone reductase-like Zn-dependent oxidoreductase